MQAYTPRTQTAVQQAVMNILFDADGGRFDNKSFSHAPTLSHNHHSFSQTVQYTHPVSHTSYPNSVTPQQHNMPQSQSFLAPSQYLHETHYHHSNQPPHKSQNYPHYPPNSRQQFSAEQQNHYLSPSTLIEPPITSPDSETSVVDISAPSSIQSTHTTPTPVLSPTNHSESNMSMDDYLPTQMN